MIGCCLDLARLDLSLWWHGKGLDVQGLVQGAGDSHLGG